MLLGAMQRPDLEKLSFDELVRLHPRQEISGDLVSAPNSASPTFRKNLRHALIEQLSRKEATNGTAHMDGCHA